MYFFEILLIIKVLSLFTCVFSLICLWDYPREDYVDDTYQSAPNSLVYTFIISLILVIFLPSFDLIKQVKSQALVELKND